MTKIAINYENGWKRSRDVRRETMLRLAEAVDRTLFEAIERNDFGDMPSSEITLTFLTSFLNEKGCRSSTGNPLSASGVMRALSLIGADWQSYRTQIIEKQLSYRSRRDLEADYRGNPAVNADSPTKELTEEAKKRIEYENRKRSERWLYYISPLTVYEMTAPPGVSFDEWLDGRQKASGKRFRITYEERVALIPKFKQWHYEKYGWFSETYVEPEFHLPRRKPKSDA